MRLRIQTIPPLPELKAWYSADHDTTLDATSTIAHLKNAICLQFSTLTDLGVNRHHLVFLLDSFELLDDSSLGLLRDGDLICIKALSSVQPALFRKRKMVNHQGQQYPPR
jgi:hypothetical protein